MPAAALHSPFPVRDRLSPRTLFAIAYALLAAGVLLNLVAAYTGQKRLARLEAQVINHEIDSFAIARQSAADAQNHARLQLANLAILGTAAILAAIALRLNFRPRTLPDWITVCAWTRRVQWQGRWVSFEEFLAQRYDVRCTHGICDEEAEKLRQL